MKKEINFRLGKGSARESKKSASSTSLFAICKWVGMSDEEIKNALKTPGKVLRALKRHEGEEK